MSGSSKETESIASNVERTHCPRCGMKIKWLDEYQMDIGWCPGPCPMIHTHPNNRAAKVMRASKPQWTQKQLDHVLEVLINRGQAT